MSRLSQVYFVLLGICIIALNACSSITATEDPIAALRGKSAAHIYQQAESAFAQKNYSDAAKYYQALSFLHPLSLYAEPAQLQLIRSYYYERDMHSAVVAAERFIRFYPKSSKVETAYYLKALANFEQDRSWFLRYANVDLSRRDPGTMRQAWQDFSTFIQQFPKSPYVPEAKKRLKILRQQFADYELHITDYYFRKGAYVAAINRASDLMKAYPDTSAAQRAVEIQKAAQAALFP